jgi:hypothetical protein
MSFISRYSHVFLCLLLILLFGPALPALAQQGPQQPGTPAPQAPVPAPTAPAAPVNTPADFESARQKAADETKNAQTLLRANAALRNAADAATTSLKTSVASRQADASAVRVLTDEDAQLQGLLDGKVVDGLSKAGANADAETKKLTPLKTSLDNLKASADYANLPPVTQDQFVQTLSDSASALSQLAKESDLNAQSASNLQAVLPQVIVQANEITKKWADSLTPLSTNATTPPADAAKFAPMFQANLPGFVNIANAQDLYTSEWNTMSPKLTSLLQSGTTLTAKTGDVDSNLKLVSGSIPNISKAMCTWFPLLKNYATTEMQALADLTKLVRTDAPTFSVSGLAETQKATGIHDLLQSISDSSQAIFAITSKLGTAAQPFDANAARKCLADMNTANQALNGSVAILQEAISGDRSDFVADQMPLYYFTDVPRLIKMLNPAAYEIGGIQGAQAQADVAKQKLAESELQLTSAMNAVNSYQTRLMQLPAELKQARADANSANNKYGQTANHLSGLTDQLNAATKRYDTTSSTASGAPTNRAAQLDLQNSLAAKNRLASQTATAQTDNTNAFHDKDVADKKLQAAEDEQTGIPAQIAQAKIALEAAQNNVSQRRQESLLAAMAESDAFGLARDNAPYWYAPAVGVSKDVARRVEMFGTNDSKIIYLRGQRPDVIKVKGMIIKIDAPSSQARVTLWSLQLNYTNDAKGTSVKKLNEALKKVEDTLAEIRFHMAESVSLLRDSVNAELDEVMKKNSKCKTAQECRLDRIRNFYNRQVLLQLGDADSKPESFKAVSILTVPDPAGTTTLGEALMIMSLAKPEIRSSIFTNFADSFKKQKPASFQPANWTESEDPFKNLRRALDIDHSAPDNAKLEFTSFQREIIYALQSVAFQRLNTQASSLIARLAVRNDALQNLCTQIAPINHKLGKAAPVPCAGYPPPPVAADPSDSNDVLNARRTQLLAQIYAAQADVQTVSAEIGPILWHIWQQFGVRPPLAQGFDEATLAALGTDVAKRTALTTVSLAQAELEQVASTTARAREAAADEMLKELMTAMEEDLDRDFVRPGLAQLRKDILSQGNLQVGVLQRTSVLATNRLAARVDPRASAQLSLGEREDILQSVMQLGQIYLAAQSGGVLGAFSALKNLQGQTQEPPQEIYGITTGNQFKITPIFDPTGQALRFKFDYVSANNVLDPNGTMNPQLPRIERHTVNTEVQISNMELREISRYEANSRLGLPTKYWGGIPILKDIPYVRPVPLIGWFVRHGGSGAVSQESLIFGQTAIYPSIGEITDLLTGDPTEPFGAAVGLTK